MNAVSYFALRRPPQRMGEAGEKSLSQPGQISGLRISLALIGLLIGIVASFYVSGLNRSNSALPAAQQPSSVAGAPAVADSLLSPQSPPGVSPITWAEFPKILILSLVICALTFPALYLGLRPYEHERAFLVLFLGFQYGFFWQSTIHAVVG